MTLVLIEKGSDNYENSHHAFPHSQWLVWFAVYGWWRGKVE